MESLLLCTCMGDAHEAGTQSCSHGQVVVTQIIWEIKKSRLRLQKSTLHYRVHLQGPSL